MKNDLDSVILEAILQGAASGRVVIIDWLCVARGVHVEHFKHVVNIRINAKQYIKHSPGKWKGLKHHAKRN